MSALGAAALALAQQELAAGVCEEPRGSNTGPRVRLYLGGCVRGGKGLGLTAAEWCASFVSFCVWTAAWPEMRPGAPGMRTLFWSATDRADRDPPIGYRAAVAELVADARAASAWHDVSEIAPGAGPQPGDLLVFGRGGHDPRAGGTGHVAIVETGDTGSWVAIGGNQGDAVSAQPRGLQDVAEPLVGWIALSTTLPEGDAEA